MLCSFIYSVPVMQSTILPLPPYVTSLHSSFQKVRSHLIFSQVKVTYLVITGSLGSLHKQQREKRFSGDNLSHLYWEG